MYLSIHDLFASLLLCYRRFSVQFSVAARPFQSLRFLFRDDGTAHHDSRSANLVISRVWLNRFLFLAEELREAGLIEDVSALAA